MKPMKLMMMIHTWLMIFFIFLVTTTTTSTPQNNINSPVLDTAGGSLQRGMKYYIKPEIVGNVGCFTMMNRNRNDSCPFYISQDQKDVVSSSSSSGLLVIFSLFVRGQKVVRENKIFKIEFAKPAMKTSRCNSTNVKYYSTVWGVGLQDPESGRRVIVTGDNKGNTNYFYVIRLSREEEEEEKEEEEEDEDDDDINIMYGLRWCHVEICPSCRFYCGDVGVFVENGKRLLALDGNSLVIPIVFERA